MSIQSVGKIRSSVSLNGETVLSGFVVFLSIVLALVFVSPGCWAQSQGEGEEGFERLIDSEPLNKALTYIYTISRWVGERIRQGVNQILPPEARLSGSLSGPIGVMVILTLFLIVAELAKKITWGLVVVGWLLILVRVGLIIGGAYW